MSIVNTENTEHYQWGPGAEGWHLLKEETLSIIEEKVAPGGEEQCHIHQRARQFFYILSGTAHIEIDGIEYALKQGNGIHVPTKTPHRLKNKSKEDLRFLVVSQPKSHGDRIDV